MLSCLQRPQFKHQHGVLSASALWESQAIHPGRNEFCCKKLPTPVQLTHPCPKSFPAVPNPVCLGTHLWTTPHATPPGWLEFIQKTHQSFAFVQTCPVPFSSWSMLHGAPTKWGPPGLRVPSPAFPLWQRRGLKRLKVAWRNFKFCCCKHSGRFCK